MRGRILLIAVLGAVAMVACSKRDSLYIEPGKAEAPAKAAPAKPAHVTPPKS
jgi:hypothetical protein